VDSEICIRDLGESAHMKVRLEVGEAERTMLENQIRQVPGVRDVRWTQ